MRAVRSPTRRYLPFIIAFVAGCNSPGSEEGASVPSIDTVSNVVVVQNPPEGSWTRDQAWDLTLEFEFKVPPDVGVPFTNRLTAVARGPNGQWLVLDYPGRRVTVLGPDGELVRQFGRAGKGPGEFSAPSAIAWDGESEIWVAEGFQGWYNVFDSAGNFRRTVERPIRRLRRLPHPLVFESPRTFIDEGSDGGIVRALRIHRSGKTLSVFSPLVPPPLNAFRGISFRPDQDEIRRVSRFYLPRLRWALGPKHTAWVANTGSLALHHIDLETGDTLRRVLTSHRDPRLSSDERALVHRGLAQVGLDPGDVDVVKPVVQAIFVLSDGHVLVQVIDEPGEDGDMLDVFDPGGTFLGTLDAGIGLAERAIPAIVGDTIIGVVLGTYDEPRIVKAVIRR